MGASGLSISKRVYYYELLKSIQIYEFKSKKEDMSS